MNRVGNASLTGTISYMVSFRRVSPDAITFVPVGDVFLSKILDFCLKYRRPLEPIFV